jgi:hypothetical protein
LVKLIDNIKEVIEKTQMVLEKKKGTRICRVPCMTALTNKFLNERRVERILGCQNGKRGDKAKAESMKNVVD